MKTVTQIYKSATPDEKTRLEIALITGSMKVWDSLPAEYKIKVRQIAAKHGRAIPQSYK